MRNKPLQLYEGDQGNASRFLARNRFLPTRPAAPQPTESPRADSRLSPFLDHRLVRAKWPGPNEAVSVARSIGARRSRRRHSLAAVIGGQAAIGRQGDVLVDELHVAVGEGEVGPLRVVAAERVLIRPVAGVHRVVLVVERDGAGAGGGVRVGPGAPLVQRGDVLANHDSVALAVLV